MPTAPLAACLEPRCPDRAVPGSRGRCAAHRRTTPQRGYGRAHRLERERIAATLPSPCLYCPEPVLPSDRWVAAHVVDGLDSSPRRAAHALCNERAKGRGAAPARDPGALAGDPRGVFRTPSVRAPFPRAAF